MMKIVLALAFTNSACCFLASTSLSVDVCMMTHDDLDECPHLLIAKGTTSVYVFLARLQPQTAHHCKLTNVLALAGTVGQLKSDCEPSRLISERTVRLLARFVMSAAFNLCFFSA